MSQNWFAKFKQNKRGYYSFLIFAVVFFLTLFVELIANDKPIFISLRGNFYFPIVQTISEKELGGVFESEVDYRDQAVLQMIKNQNGTVIWPPIKFSYDTINYNINAPAPSRPTFDNLLGTDDNGRDVLARILYGIRISLIFGLMLTAASLVLAIVIGAVQGYFGGRVDIFVQRFVEIWSSFPLLFLLITMSSIIEPSFFTLLFLLLLFSWISLSSYIRAEFLRIKNFDFVMAARALGASDSRIIFRHILPNSVPVIISNLPFLLSGSIITLTSLDFIGLGMPVESPSLGELLAQGKNNINAYWLGLSGFVVVASILTLLIFVGEAMRDAFKNQ